MWGMHCWNGLSAEQAEFLRTEGYLPIFTAPQGECLSGAEVEVTTMYDKFPGPRFYCLPCAVEYLTQLTPSDTRHTPQTGCGLCE